MDELIYTLTPIFLYMYLPQLGLAKKKKHWCLWETLGDKKT